MYGYLHISGGLLTEEELGGRGRHRIAGLWLLSEGLSELLPDGEWPAEASAWESVPKEQIRQAARRLLQIHDNKLADLGPSTAKGVVNL